MTGQFWREAATLLLISRLKSNSNVSSFKNAGSLKFNSSYNLLTMQRSSTSTFMPRNYVFPGGTLDASDLNPKWYSLFSKLGVSYNELNNFSRSELAFDDFNKKEESGELPSWLACRICALRETFEETGILLVDSCNESNNSQIYHLDKEDLEKWRDKIYKDSSEYFNLLSQLNKLPAVLKLQYWTQWLTPSSYGKKSKRFDTSFFIAFTEDQIPVNQHLQSEVAQISICQPETLLHSYYKEEINLAPPQIYELLKLLKFRDFDDLREFANTNRMISRLFPVKMRAPDGIVSLLPGDDLYPIDPDYYGNDDQLRTKTPFINQEVIDSKIHRFVFADKNKTLLTIKNMTDCDYVYPLSSIDFISRSKL